MRSFLPALALVLAGCYGPLTPPPPMGDFLTDPVDPEFEPAYDLIAARFKELNGSVVLTLEFREFSDGSGQRVLPQFVARFEVVAEEGGLAYFTRNEPALDKPAPHLRWVMGRVEDGQYIVLHEVCAVVETTQKPWQIQVDLLHNETGLVGGGTIRGLEVDTSDFENHSKDAAESDQEFRVRGGPNPHDICPLVAERREPSD